MKLRSYKSNFSLSKEYFIFASIVVAAVIGICVAVSWNTYASFLDRTTHIIQTDTTKINRLLRDSFDETNQIMVYIGKQIAKNGGKDLFLISNLLKNTSGTEYKSANLLSWSRFDWVSPNNLQLVNSKNGIVSNPPDMSIREYTWKSREHPWTLQVSRPTIGNPSNMWVIPAGTGVTGPKGDYLGTLVVGFNIAELTTKIENILNGTITNFVVLDNNMRIILHSADNDIGQENDTFTKMMLAQTLTGDNNTLDAPITYNDIIYRHYLKMDGYPYAILTGINQNIASQELYSALLPRILGLLLSGVAGLILLFIFRKKIINPISGLAQTATAISKGNYTVKIPRQTSKEMLSLAVSLALVKRSIKKNLRYQTQLAEACYQLQLAEVLKKKNQELEEIKERLEYTADLVKASDDAKEEFIRRINQELTTPLDTIICYGDVLTKVLKGEVKVGISAEKQLEMIEKMVASAMEIKTLTSNILNIKPIDVPAIISDCVIVLLKEAITKNIQIHTTVAPDIPCFYADDLRFRQIVLGLLFRSIEYTPKAGTIKIDVSYTNKNDATCLLLSVEDNGFGLSAEDIDRLNNKFGTDTIGHKNNGIGLELSAIKKLIRMHKGTYKIDSKLAKGTIITVTFPYNKETKLPGNSLGTTNVVKLFNEKNTGRN